MIAALPAQAWRRRSAGDGAKGERRYDWARTRIRGVNHPDSVYYLLARRSGIGLHTPADVHHHRTDAVDANRQATLLAARAEHHERFTPQHRGPAQGAAPARKRLDQPASDRHPRPAAPRRPSRLTPPGLTRLDKYRIATQHDLNDTKHHPRAGTVSVRWIYLLIIDDFARHTGHSDILVEQINDMHHEVSSRSPERPA